jgi:predicted Zn-dependent protease
LWIFLTNQASAHPESGALLTYLSAQITKEPSNAGLYAQRARVYVHMRRPDLAWVDQSRAVRLDPGLAELPLLAAEILFAMGQPSAALAEIEQFLRERPEDLAALRLAAETLSSLGRHQEAASVLQRLISLLSRPTPDLVLELARELERAGQPVEALKALDPWLARYPRSTALFENAIRIELALGRREQAIVRLERLAKLSPRAEEWLRRRADLLAEAKSAGEARHRHEKPAAGRERP